jgi:hypothetical protein
MVAVRFFGLVEALKTREQIQQLASWSFLERFGLLVDQQWWAHRNEMRGDSMRKSRGQQSG